MGVTVSRCLSFSVVCFFFNDTATTEIYTLSLHDALPILNPSWVKVSACVLRGTGVPVCTVVGFPLGATLADVKAYETRRAIFDGAREIDMVINIGALKSGDD